MPPAIDSLNDAPIYLGCFDVWISGHELILVFHRHLIGFR